MKSFMRAIALALPFSVVACAGGGGDLGQVLGDVLGGGGSGGGTGTMVVEVQSVDQQRQEIQVLTEDGQRGPIRYDQNTTVVYQNEQYPVTALEAGDVVEMRLQQLSGGGYYTDYITVRQSVQDRGGTSSGGTGQLVQASGTVRQIDYQRGLFTLQTTQGTVTVSLPYNPSAGTVDRFESLDSGERVTVEGYLVGTGRIELVRFR